MDEASSSGSGMGSASPSVPTGVLAEVRWSTLEHGGPVFPAAYKKLPEGVGLKYDGTVIKLSEPAEEMAVAYAKILDTWEPAELDDENVKENFFRDWKAAMTEEERELITEFSKCDFSSIRARNKLRSAHQADVTDEQRHCMIDGKTEEIMNCKMEPPGIFKGMSKNKNNGKWKRRILPKDVTINCSQGKQPEGAWDEIVCDQKVLWLAKWRDPIYYTWKYMRLSSKAAKKGEIDREKFDAAVRLGQNIDRIRDDYRECWTSDDPSRKQLGLALYCIHTFAFRAGGDHTESDDVDTVGCCSLRKEHIKLSESNVIKFDFRGKGSTRYKHQQQIDPGAFQALQSLIADKGETEKIFDLLNPDKVNSFLKGYDADFSIKVFRTFCASALLELELMNNTERGQVQQMKKTLRNATLKVAQLCNHLKDAKILEEISGLEQKIDGYQRELDKTRGYANRKLKEKALNKAKSDLQQLLEKEKAIPYSDKAKEHYIDPRIIVAWCIKYHIPIEVVYRKTLREKFQWAIELGCEDYVFFEQNKSNSRPPSRRQSAITDFFPTNLSRLSTLLSRDTEPL